MSRASLISSQCILAVFRSPQGGSRWTQGPTPCATGTLGEVVWPEMEGVRVDTWIETGSVVSPHYDSLLAKLMVFAPEGRAAAIKKMQAALAATKVRPLPPSPAQS